MVIDDSRNSVRRVLRVIDTCVILHNLLVEVGEDEIPNEWYDSDDELSDEDTNDVGADIGEYGYADAIDDDLPNDTRRTRCMEYFRDHGVL
jgi:hypothetical protein